MTYQRRHGIPVKVWAPVVQTDARDNKQLTVDTNADPITGKAWIYPQRSARAEVPGQQRINVIRVGLDANLSGVEFKAVGDLYGRVEFMGKTWDVVAPPAYHHGTRHTRHWSVDLRERP